MLEQIGARQTADALIRAQIYGAKGPLEKQDRDEVVERMVDDEAAECIVSFVNEHRHMLRVD